MASDMMPIPALCGLFIHTIWLIVFGPIVAHYDVMTIGRGCGRPGVQYKATCAGFLAIYALSWVGELALFVVGCRGVLHSLERSAVASAAHSRSTHTCCKSCAIHPIDAGVGTPLEVQKRKAVVPLLYAMTVLWLAQIGFASAIVCFIITCAVCPPHPLL